MKRLLAMLLSVCMLISMLPAVSIVSAADGYTFVYDFNMGWDNDVKINTKTSYDITGARWEWAGESTDMQVITHKWGLQSYAKDKAERKPGRWFAMKLKTPVPGTYTAILTHGQRKAAAESDTKPAGEVYFIPADGRVTVEEGIKNADYRIADEVKYYAAKNVSAATSAIKNAVVEEGVEEYYLVFVTLSDAAVGDGKQFYYQYPHILTLSNGSGAVLDSLFVSTDKTELDTVEKKTAQLSFSGTGSDLQSKAVNLSDYTDVSFKAVPENIVTVSNAGAVTAIGAGTVQITASLKNEAGEIVTSNPVTITVVEGEVINPEDIPLSEHKFVYDFNIDNSTDVQLVNYNYGNTYGLWEYAGGTVKNTSVETHKYGAEISASKAEAFSAFKIYLPVAGRYSASLAHGQSNSSGGYGNVYILPVEGTENLEAEYKSGTKLAEDVCYYRQEGSRDTFTDLPGWVVVPEGEEGEYYIVFEATKAGGGKNGDASTAGFRMYPHVLTLSGGDKTVLTALSAEIERDRLDTEVMTTTVMSVKAHGGDMTELDASDYEITYESSDSRRATVSENGEITALREGKVTITASAVNEAGKRVSASKDVIVGEEGIKILYSVGSDSYVLKGGDNDPPTMLTGMTESYTNGFYKFRGSTLGTPEELAEMAYKAEVLSSFRSRADNIQISKRNALAFEVYVPRDGVYELHMFNGISEANGGTVDVYLSRAEDFDKVYKSSAKNDLDKINESLGTYVGTYDCYGKGAGTFDMITPAANIFEDIDLKKGKYVFSFLAGEPSSESGVSSSSAYGSVGDFVLTTGGDVAVVMNAALTGVSEGVAEAKIVMSDKSVVNANSAYVSYRSENPEVAYVNNKTGHIRKLSSGTAEISATVVSDEFTGTLCDTLVVTDVSATQPCSGEVIRYDFTRLKSGWTPYTNLEGMKQSVTPKGIEPDGEVKYTGASRDTDIRGITYDYTDGNWQWFGSSFGAKDGDAYRFDDRARLNPPKGEWVAFTIKVPAAGRYSASIDKRTHVDSGEIANVYVVPKAQNVSGISSALGFDSRVGRVAFLDPAPGGWASATEELCVIDFPASGEYVLVFECYEKVGPQDGMVNLTAITLDGEEKLNRVHLSSEKTTLGFEDKAQISLSAYTLSGRKLDAGEYTVTYESSDNSVAEVDKNGLVISRGDGHCVITATVSDGKAVVKGVIDITAVDETPIVEKIFKVDSEIFVRETVKSALSVVRDSGNTIDVPASDIIYTFSEGGIVSIDASGKVTGLKTGTVTVTARALYRGEVVEASSVINVTVDSGKSEPTYYTAERRANVIENVQKYDWAKKLQKNAEKQTEQYVANYELIYNLIPREGIPRSRQIGSPNDPNYKICRYCGVNVVGKYGKSGTGGWQSNSFARTWKVQCPDCKRLFPSNDFELLYERGLDENGVYNRELAKENNAKAVARGEKDALVNELYPEIANQITPANGGDGSVAVTINGGLGLRPGESAKTWGVDDGWGYIPKDPDGNPYMCNDDEPERHCYVALYHFYFWTEVRTTLDRLRTAYLYTGDEKYGRAGAILLDRVADVYSEYNLLNYNTPTRVWMNTDGGSRFGQIQGKIADNWLAETAALSADAFYPMLSDSQVINYLSAKSAELGLENSKTSKERIWDNWENGLLLAAFDAAKNGRIKGNFGQVQATMSAVSVVLDREPDSAHILDWLYETEVMDKQTGAYTGANVASQLIDIIDRDGMGHEASANYNNTEPEGLFGMADYLSFYKGDTKYNPANNPKFMQMFMAFIPVVSVEAYEVNVGDGMNVAEPGFSNSLSTWVSVYKYFKDPEMKKKLAQYIYLRNGKSVEGLNLGIFEKDPESIQEEILAVAEKNPEPESEMMAGYGLAILRDGANYSSVSASTEKNNLRDFWIGFGTNGASHAHSGTLNLGVDAFGLNLSPDLGYPENTGSDPNRVQWVSATVSHNTVVVDEANQKGIEATVGRPRHFDDAGTVKLIDVEADSAYTQVDNYRRTLVMVEVNDDISYGVDFFRVTGGDKHTYSFHAQSEKAAAVEGLTMVAQENPETTYAAVRSGEEVAYGPDPGGNKNLKYPSGYTWMRKVRQDKNPGDRFAIDFEITDYRKVVNDGKNIRLRMTQMNNFDASEVAIVGGMVPVKTANAPMPEQLEYVLAHREGKNLDSLFTTVYEPYRGERYISAIEPVEVAGEVSSGNMARAVKVTHTSGRVDYIVYATDNSVTYTVRDKETDGTDVFKFRGFAGVYSLMDGDVIYRYVNDGDIISAGGSETGAESVYTGKVKGYQTDLSLDNYIDVTVDCDDLSKLAGKYMYVANDDVQSGAYLIKSVSDSEEDIPAGCVRFDIGAVSLIRGHKDIYDPDGGYVYNISEGQSFVIPMSFADEGNPEIQPVSGNITTSAGNSVSVTVKARSFAESDSSIEYIGTTLPRGASVNSTTGVFTWKPDKSQIGENHVAITARDALGRESTVHFYIEVYGSTTGNSSSDKTQDDKTETPSDGTTVTPPTGGGGAGGGGAAPVEKPEDGKEGNESGEKEENTENEGNTDNTGTEKTPLRFVDLNGYTWAENAIAALSEAEIIKGTSETSFSPEKNITRADFALLLVRAFKLTSDNTENFADVSASDYFASELAIARNTGIVGGMGENKYAPRNNITRQDMMVIVYRALQKLNVEFGTYAEPQYEDFSAVAPYACDAVSTLIGAGLVNGKSGRIAPTDYTTRAEVAVLVKRILDYIK